MLSFLSTEVTLLLRRITRAVSFTLVQSHTFWKEIPRSKLCKARFISFRNKKNRDVCGTISTWYSLAHWGNRQETHGVAAWWKVRDCSTLTGLVERILNILTCFHFTIFLEKKSSACCLLKTNAFLGTIHKGCLL